MLYNLATECVPRTRNDKCSNIRDRKTCLISEDNLGDYAGPCGWCGKSCGGARYENNNVCEPVKWLKDAGISFYETCLKQGIEFRTFQFFLMNQLYLLLIYSNFGLYNFFILITLFELIQRMKKLKRSEMFGC